MCILWGTNWVFIFQKMPLFIVTAAWKPQISHGGSHFMTPRWPGRFLEPAITGPVRLLTFLLPLGALTLRVALPGHPSVHLSDTWPPVAAADRRAYSLSLPTQHPSLRYTVPCWGLQTRTANLIPWHSGKRDLESEGKVRNIIIIIVIIFISINPVQSRMWKSQYNTK
jgi:hypothetical protein